MSKTLTEQWKNGELLAGLYYFRKNDGLIYIEFHDDYRGFCTPEEYIKEVLAPVPSYESLYNPNDGRSNTTGVFTVLKLIKRDIDNAQKRRSLTDLECGIKSQVVSLLKKWGLK